MSIFEAFSSLFSNVSASTSNCESSKREEIALIGKENYGSYTRSGSYVNVDSAMQLSVVYACIRVITQTFASTPFFLYQNTEQNGKHKARGHPLFSVLQQSSKPSEPAFRWREKSMMDLLTNGNTFSQIIRNRRGEIAALRHLPHECVKVDASDDMNIKYHVMDSKGIRWDFTTKNMLHIPALGDKNGLGLSPISIARETIGKGLSASQYGADFFMNGGQISAIVGIQDGITKNDKSFEQLKKDWANEYNNPSGNGRPKTAFIPGGISYNKVTVTPEEAQFLETIKATRQEICGIFGVPPHMVADLERATFSNIEEQSIEFVQNTMIPWYERFESYVDTILLSDKEVSSGYYSKHNANIWLRGNVESRGKFYQMMTQNGIMNPDEIRELEDMNPQEGGQGKKYHRNGALVSASSGAEGDGK